MAPQPTSREGSIRSNHLSRRSSALSGRSNVFSDEHAYSDGDLDPLDSIHTHDHLTLADRETRPRITSDIPRSAIPLSFTSSERPNSTSQRLALAGSSSHPMRAVSLAAQSDAGTQRTLSTSSRFSIPRAPSPYNGPTAPSQPYPVHAQVTRASSIASESTVRRPERPFVANGGPEHPYAMYQNTVPEEDDDNGLHGPLNVPGSSDSHRDGSSSSGNDTGDIVGSDGHIEQLPPYSRYADNVIAKGDMGTIEPLALSTSEATSPPSEPVRFDSSSELNPNRAEATAEEEDEVARKEGWIARHKHRRCCGMPFWFVVIICLVVVAAATLGGVIGGVIGNEKGTDRALATSAATTTVWLDADPAQTGPGTPACPTGHYTIPLNATEQINACVIDISLGITWDCMDQAYLGISLWDQGPNNPYSVTFDDYSLRPQLFQYGPQPPDFNGTTFPLQPVKDKDDGQLGVAMYFNHLFDKIIILPSDALPPPPGPPIPPHSKRSVEAEYIKRRGYTLAQQTFLAVGDQPWFCFWNATVEEFWIFLEKDLHLNSTSSSLSQTTSAPSTAHTSSAAMTTSYTHSSYGANTASGTSTKSYSNTYSASPTSGPYPPRMKRSSPYSDTDPQHVFPKLIKMVEKRKPHGNVQPYCQQMQVLNDWQIMPIPNIPTVVVQEAQYAQPTGTNKKRFIRRGDSTQELESNCICEWFSAAIPDDG